MILVGDKKMACASCIRGHRSGSCAHYDRQMCEIRPKGRPPKHHSPQHHHSHARQHWDGKQQHVVATKSILKNSTGTGQRWPTARRKHGRRSDSSDDILNGQGQGHAPTHGHGHGHGHGEETTCSSPASYQGEGDSQPASPETETAAMEGIISSGDHERDSASPPPRNERQVPSISTLLTAICSFSVPNKSNGFQSIHAVTTARIWSEWEWQRPVSGPNDRAPNMRAFNDTTHTTGQRNDRVVPSTPSVLAFNGESSSSSPISRHDWAGLLEGDRPRPSFSRRSSQDTNANALENRHPAAPHFFDQSILRSIANLSDEGQRAARAGPLLQRSDPNPLILSQAQLHTLSHTHSHSHPHSQSHPPLRPHSQLPINTAPPSNSPNSELVSSSSLLSSSSPISWQQLSTMLSREAAYEMLLQLSRLP